MTMTTVKGVLTPQAGLGNTRTYSDSGNIGKDFSTVMDQAAGKGTDRYSKVDPEKKATEIGSGKTDKTQDPKTKTPEKSGEKPGEVKDGDKTQKAEATTGKADAARKPAEAKGTETPEVQEEAGTLERMEDLSTALGQLNEAILQMVARVTETTPAEVQDVMNTLDLGAGDLLTQEGLTELVTAVSGEEEGTALLTNDHLYQQVQEVLEQAQVLETETAQSLGTEPEMLGALADRLDKVLSRQEDTITSAAGLQENQNADRRFQGDILTETGTEKAVSGTETDRPVQAVANSAEEAEADLAGQEDGAETETFGSRAETETFGSRAERTEVLNERPADPFMQAVDQNLQAVDQNLQTREGLAAETAAVETNTPVASAREIMDQILDYMRIQAKPEVTELEMQLNPENLGTLHLTLTSREGIMTAQFTTQSEEVQSVIQSQLMILRENLENQGIKVEAVEVTIAQYSQEGREAFGQNAEGERQNFAGGGRRNRIRNIDLNLLTEDPEEMDNLSEEEKLTAEVMKANGQTVDYMA